MACDRKVFAVGIKLIAIMMALSVCPSLKAQSFYGSIVGTVTDGTGAVVPDAQVMATNVGTNESVSVKSDPSGKFSFVNLLPATYKVSVDKGGFKRFLQDRVTVEVNNTVRLDAMLQVGAANETVEVSPEAAQLKSDSSTLSTEIGAQQVQEMPLNGRNVLNLIALTPGVVPTGAAMGATGLNQGTRTAGGAGWGDYEIGGAIQGQSAQFIDGVANNLLIGNVVGLVPTQDAIQEFSVASSNATADFGRFSGGVVNMATKSGGNAFHGSAWEYLRNRDFNANDYFSNQNGSARPQYNQNQYGASVSGPIVRNKMFFMFTWEGYRSLTGNLTPTNVPTTALQNGIFPNAITDPLGICSISTTVNPGSWTITNLYGPSANPAYPNATCGDATNKIIKTFYPAPNATGASNWFLTTPLGNKQNQYNGRVDYTLGPNDRLFARYTYWTLQDTAHSEFLDQGFGGTKWPTNDGQQSDYTHQAVVGETHTFNPTTVLDVRLNFMRQYSPNIAQSAGLSQSQFGSQYTALASQESFQEIPGFNVSGGLHGLYAMSNYINDSITWYDTYGINGNLVKIVGPHSFKFGTEVRLMDQSEESFSGGASGTYTYSTNWSGDEWANFLMGYPTAATFKTALRIAAYTYYQGYYAMDTWQAAKNLTFTLGLRYELPGAIAERNNKATVLLPNTVDPTTGITGTESLVASSLYPSRSNVIPYHTAFAPRVGAAIRLTPTTAIRGGFGISFLPNDIPSGANPDGNYVNGATTTVNVPTSGNPVPLTQNLVPLTGSTTTSILNQIVASGITPSPGRTNPNFMTLLGSKTAFLNQNLTAPDPYQSYPWVEQWNMSLSHQFQSNLVAEVSYNGLHGTNLPLSGSRNLNELPDQYDSMGSALAVKQACAAANNLVVSVGQCLRPYPFYNNVSDSIGYVGIENYRSFQAKGEKRMGAGGIIMANYTYARNLGNTDTQNGYLESKSVTQGGSGSAGIQDWNNLKGEYSLISYDVTNRIIVAYNLNLPFGKGKKYANGFSDFANNFVSGWAINGDTTIQSGFPIFLTAATNNQLIGFGANNNNTRPMVVPGCNKKIGGSGLARVQAGGWFNIYCFENDAASSLSTNGVTQYPNGLGSLNPTPTVNSVPFTQYQFGNEPRTDPTLRADGIKNFDFSFQKSTSLHEKLNLEFRTEFFNIFNRVQFAPPGPTAGSNNFGQVTYQVNRPRQLQLSLRLNY
jgi:hypothetical protein